MFIIAPWLIVLDLFQLEPRQPAAPPFPHESPGRPKADVHDSTGAPGETRILQSDHLKPGRSGLFCPGGLDGSVLHGGGLSGDKIFAWWDILKISFGCSGGASAEANG
ncbi:MAG TPA: hypothetical protein VFV81_04980 [Verrucomicrobiae bacterium]|nr:hypothetical protein [Verrucomicrobiae bacterium]